MPDPADFYEENPFVLVHNKLWELVEAHPNCGSIVAAGNRIKFNSPTVRNPIKPSVQDADLPELMLVTNGGDTNLMDTSSSTRVTRRWDFIISTGDLRTNHYLYQVEWMLLVALLGWKTELTALEWKEKTFVKKLTVPDIDEGQSDKEKNRNIEGWSSLWRCDVEMHFKTKDLTDDLIPPAP